MLSKRETQLVLEQFFTDCVKFQKKDGKNEREAYMAAIQDIYSINHNPYSPQGEELNQEAKTEFLRIRLTDLGDIK
jgi:hypothetical protein